MLVRLRPVGTVRRPGVRFGAPGKLLVAGVLRGGGHRLVQRKCVAGLWG
ncbi:MAG: hypothetical protein LKG15_03365 [Corynebacterium provencense]|nr:hypothetical protein [Corynebacterium provencense]